MKKPAIISDGWASYSNLSNYGYFHKIELHNTGFLKKYPNSTNPIKRCWSAIKRKLAQYQGGFKENTLQTFIDEANERRTFELNDLDFDDYILEIIKDSNNIE